MDFFCFVFKTISSSVFKFLKFSFVIRIAELRSISVKLDNSNFIFFLFKNLSKPSELSMQ